MKRLIVLALAVAVMFGIACSGEEATQSADDAAATATEAATSAADAATGAAADAASAVGDSAVAACKALAEKGAWGEALEVCKRAHEMMPDDLALEHAYQQAKAAAE